MIKKVIPYLVETRQHPKHPLKNNPQNNLSVSKGFPRIYTNDDSNTHSYKLISALRET